jgi:hypothetical protein
MQLSSLTRLMLFTPVCAIVTLPLFALADDGRPGIPLPQPTLAEYDIIVADGASRPTQNELLACEQAKTVALQIARVAHSYQTQVLRVRHTSSPTIHYDITWHADARICTAKIRIEWPQEPPRATIPRPAGLVDR